MNTLAKALIETAAFLELSGDAVLCPDDAVRALENIAHALHSASPEELLTLRTTLCELISLESAGLARPDLLIFYENFFANFGLPSDWAEK